MAHSVFTDSFSYQAADILKKHTSKVGTMSINLTGGPRGNPVLRCGAENGAYLKKSVPSCQFGVIGGLVTLPANYVWPTPPAGATAHAVIASFWGPTNTNIFLSVTPSRALAVYRSRYTNNGAIALLAVSSDGVVPFDIPTYIEIGAKIATAGSVEVRVNGSNVVIPPTAVNTSYDTETIQALSIGADGFPAGGFGYAWVTKCSMDFSDVYYAYGSEIAFKGISRVSRLTLTADSTPQDWSKSAADPAWQILANQSGYISSDVGDATSLFDLSDLVGSPSIHGIQVEGIADLSEAGSTGFAFTVKSGASQAQGAANYPTITPNSFQSWFATDPATSSAWTPAGLNAAKVGPVVKL